MQEPAGLMHALLLDGGGGGKSISWKEVCEWQPGQGCLWLHFDYRQEDTQQWILEQSGLNDVAADGLLCEENRPHVLNRGDNLLVVLRGVNLNPGSNPEDMVSLRLWTDGARVLSTRGRALQSTNDVMDSLVNGTGPKDAASLIVEWLDRIVWRMSDTVDGFEDELLAMEEELLDINPREMRMSLSQLRRKTIGIRRYLAPQREALNRLIDVPLTWMDDLDRLRLRGIADRQIRHIEDIDAVRERAAMAQEELANYTSEQMNQRTYVLTIVAAVFLPLGFFTGLMGINVGGMPGVENSAAFWIVVGLCVAITAGLATIFYVKRWF